MTERERDERDLNILTAYENGATKASLVRSYRVTLHYINKLLKESKE
jgi:Mor family transcriptional regulator